MGVWEERKRQFTCCSQPDSHRHQAVLYEVLFRHKQGAECLHEQLVDRSRRLHGLQGQGAVLVGYKRGSAQAEGGTSFSTAALWIQNAVCLAICSELVTSSTPLLTADVLTGAGKRNGEVVTQEDALTQLGAPLSAHSRCLCCLREMSKDPLVV